jgi:hypothetical protein
MRDTLVDDDHHVRRVEELALMGRSGWEVVE